MWPSHKMQHTFLNLRKSVDLVSARALNTQACYNALISGHPGGVTPGTYAGMGRDLLTLVANFKPGMGELGCFCTFVTGYPGKDPRDL